MTNTSTPAVFAEPTRRVPGAWIAAFAVAWLGIWMAQLAPIQKLLPDQVQAQLRTDDWVQNVSSAGPPLNVFVPVPPYR